MEMKAKKIEEKCNILKEELKKHNQYLSNINESVKKLKAERKIVESNILKLDGAIQAYSEAIRLSSESEDEVA